MGLMDWLGQKVNDIKEAVLGSDEPSKAEPTRESSNVVVPRNQVVFVRTRKSSMFYDSDGDMAHEFYEEVVGGLRRLTEGLTPVGLEVLSNPTISPACRVVILQRQGAS
mmetsp:Transcript_85348/g.118546  ORF Transcript_85348/g.118546 Transcript_85348/m.118546 type:complete len:109 (-) Transcript_85348:139-465(-)